MIQPVRLQLSRARGFRLHEASHAANGLEVRRVDRCTAFGNPFRFREDHGCIVFTSDEENTTGAAGLVAMFRRWALADPAGIAMMEQARQELRGVNLACWCGLCAAHRVGGKPFGVVCEGCAPCHADIVGVLVAGTNGLVGVGEK